jgi:hypothetical protein
MMIVGRLSRDQILSVMLYTWILTNILAIGTMISIFLGYISDPETMIVFLFVVGIFTAIVAKILGLVRDGIVAPIFFAAAALILNSAVAGTMVLAIAAAWAEVVGVDFEMTTTFAMAAVIYLVEFIAGVTALAMAWIFLSRSSAMAAEYAAYIFAVQKPKR